VQLPADREDAYGTERVFDPATARSVLLVASRFGAMDGLPGEPLDEVDLTPRTADVVDRLVEAARSAPVQRSAKAPELRAGLFGELGDLADHQIEHLATSPSEALTSPVVLQLLLDGYLDAPTFDRADLRAMLDASEDQRTLWSDDRVALRRLTVDELRAFRPDLFEGT
jgi:hypothetical protein